MMLEDDDSARRTRVLKRAVRSFLERHFPRLLPAIKPLRSEFRGLRARRARKRVGTYIGVTGSCGKSSTTNLTAALLHDLGVVRAAVQRGSMWPLFDALVRNPDRVDFFVQEISGSEPGRIASVSRFVRPDMAIVTTVGHDHFASFKSSLPTTAEGVSVDERYLQLIAEEKGSLVAALGQEGIACLNADQPLVRAMAERCKGRVVLYGRSPDAEVRAEHATAVWPRRLSFDLIVGGVRRHVQTRFVGTPALGSILAALAAVHALGGDLDRAVARLSSVEPVNLRMEVRAGPGGHTYILDTFKAPLWQVELLLDDLPAFAATPLIFVLGEVSDVRNDKSKTYRRLLRKATDHAAFVVGFGPAANSANKVRAEGRGNIIGLETYDQVRDFLAQQTPSVVLLKSNTSTKMERILETSTDEPYEYAELPREANHA